MAISKHIDDASIYRLAAEYLSKVNCCDECFCEFWCICNERKSSRIPVKDCTEKIIEKLKGEKELI